MITSPLWVVNGLRGECEEDNLLGIELEICNSVMAYVIWAYCFRVCTKIIALEGRTILILYHSFALASVQD